jgi:hypothetical protein
MVPEVVGWFLFRLLKGCCVEAVSIVRATSFPNPLAGLLRLLVGFLFLTLTRSPL